MNYPKDYFATEPNPTVVSDGSAFDGMEQSRITSSKVSVVFEAIGPIEEVLPSLYDFRLPCGRYERVTITEKKTIKYRRAYTR